MKVVNKSLHVSTPNNLSAYHRTEIPYSIFDSEESGPNVLLLAGSHGDEYEGQIALKRLVHNMSVGEPGLKSGRITILPHANLPACTNHTRLSPLDHGNLSGAFAESATGPTQAIAYAIENQFIREANIVLDFHSGGHSLYYSPIAMAFAKDDDSSFGKMVDIIGLYQVDFLGIMDPWLNRGAVPNAVARHGGIYIASEFGGAGQLRRDYCDRILRTIHNVLFSLGMIDSSEVHEMSRPATWVKCNRNNDRLYALQDGLYESQTALGSLVDQGSLAGLFYSHYNNNPIEVFHNQSGYAIATRPLAYCRRGDCLVEVASKVQPN